MKAYSLDLRERVVAAYLNGADSIREVSEQFQVSISFLKKMLARGACHRRSRAAPSGAAESEKLFPPDIVSGC